LRLFDRPAFFSSRSTVYDQIGVEAVMLFWCALCFRIGVVGCGVLAECLSTVLSITDEGRARHVLIALSFVRKANVAAEPGQAESDQAQQVDDRQ